MWVSKQDLCPVWCWQSAATQTSAKPSWRASQSYTMVVKALPTCKPGAHSGGAKQPAVGRPATCTGAAVLSALVANTKKRIVISHKEMVCCQLIEKSSTCAPALHTLDTSLVCSISPLTNNQQSSNRQEQTDSLIQNAGGPKKLDNGLSKSQNPWDKNWLGLILKQLDCCQFTDSSKNSQSVNQWQHPQTW